MYYFTCKCDLNWSINGTKWSVCPSYVRLDPWLRHYWTGWQQQRSNDAGCWCLLSPHLLCCCDVGGGSYWCWTIQRWCRCVLLSTVCCGVCRHYWPTIILSSPSAHGVWRGDGLSAPATYETHNLTEMSMELERSWVGWCFHFNFGLCSQIHLRTFF